MTTSNYTDAELEQLYNSIDDNSGILSKKIKRLLNKHNKSLTKEEIAADILANLISKNRLQTTLDDIKITSRNYNWSNRPGAATTAITNGATGERGQLDDEMSDYAYITNTSFAPRKSIVKHYSSYKRKRGAGKRKKHTKKRKHKKRKSTRKK